MPQSREFQDRQTERWALIRACDRQNNGLAVFVHGFLGDHLGTWGLLPRLLQEHAETDSVLNAWDYLFVGYKTRSVESYIDIAHHVGTQLRLAAEGKGAFTHAYQRFALMGHSLGTLGIRQLLCAQPLHALDLSSQLHSVTLFGTPLNGSPLAYFGSIIGGPIAHALQPKNPQLRMLQMWTQCSYEKWNWKKVKVVLGSDDGVVGAEYGDLIRFEGDETPHLRLGMNHSQLCKPDTWAASTVFDLVKDALK